MRDGNVPEIEPRLTSCKYGTNEYEGREKLRESESRLRKIFNCLPVMVVASMKEGNLLIGTRNVKEFSAGPKKRWLA